MEVIALRGPSKKGKSKTINIVYQYLLLFGYTQVPGHFRVLGNPDLYDCIDILEKKGVRIGIASMGDYEKGNDSVQNLLRYLDANGCSKAICACNLKLKAAINDIMQYQHHFLDKSIANNDAEQRIKNGEDAEKIFKLI